MNIALEYLTRSECTRKLLEFPCALFAENFLSGERCIILMQLIQNRDSLINVKRYNFEYSSITCVRSVVQKNKIFTDKRIILDNYLPIPYQGCPVRSRANTYNHPMTEELFNSYHLCFLNSSQHTKYKLFWLWDSFALCYLKERDVNDLNLFYCFNEDSVFLLEDEQRYVKSKKSNIWNLWNSWYGQFIHYEAVSPELVFKSAFKSNLASFF